MGRDVAQVGAKHQRQEQTDRERHPDGQRTHNPVRLCGVLVEQGRQRTEEVENDEQQNGDNQQLGQHGFDLKWMRHYLCERFSVPRIRFTPRLWPTLATLVGLLLFLRLGFWQDGKADLREAEIAQFQSRAHLGPFALTDAMVEPQAVQDAPVAVRGVFEPAEQFFVDNRQENGVAGVHVVTPLRIEGGDVRVLVNRGWIAWPGGSRKALPGVQTPPGLVTVEGIAHVPTHKNFLLMPEHAEVLPRLWPRLDLNRFTAEQKNPVQAIVVLQTSNNPGPALVRHWPPPEDRVARHRSYAYQWWGMALALLIFYGAASIRRRTTT